MDEPKDDLPKRRQSLWSRWKQVSLNNKLIIILTFVIALTNAFYVHYAAQQWKAIKEQYLPLRQSSDTAAQALKSSDASNMLTLRPYLTITEMRLFGTVANEHKFHGEARVFNSGRTPAVDIRVCGDIFITMAEKPITEDYPCPSPQNPKRNPLTTNRSVANVGPTVFGKITSPGTTATINPVGLPKLLQNGTFKLYFYGYVYYRDILNSGTEHYTLFCGVYMGTGMTDLDVCENHNHMD